MSYRKRIKFFLVHTLRVSNKTADEYLKNGLILLNGKKVNENVSVADTDEVSYNGKVLRTGFDYQYICFYKPRGFQSTLNIHVPDNLSSFFKEFKDLAIAGRLDKDSEGLLVLSNNGKWIRETTDPESKKEKEYWVELDKEPDEHFLSEFRNGVDLKFYKTREALCEKMKERQIRVILTEGKNRQIRKMCKTLGYNVLSLKRVRIDNFQLGNLKPGELILT